MSQESSGLARAAETVLARASRDVTPGSEAHIRAIAEESLVSAGINPDGIPERPMLDGIIADKLKGADGLTLFEIDFVWAVCRAIARPEASWRAALILPFHESVRYALAAPELMGKRAVMVRGTASLEMDVWEGIVATETRFAQIFSLALARVSDRFVGIARDADDLRALAGNGPANQVRLVTRAASEYTYDPVGELQAIDGIWAAAKGLERKGTSIVVWQSPEASGRGYDLSHLRGDTEFLCSFESRYLHEIVQLPDDEQSQLFIYDGAHTGPVALVDMSGETGGSKAVPAAELRFMLDYTPSHYHESGQEKRMSTIGTLVRRVQRGTSINAKALEIIRSTSDPWPGAVLEPRSMNYYNDGDLYYYVDNASLAGRHVTPRVIKDIPPKQERYTLLPEDGVVVLVARNGRGSATYTARRPTLVSNNLFIIWPDPEKAAAEYLVCSLRSAVVWQQLDSMRMPMGKSDLEGILIPVGTKELMDRVVEREKQIREEIADLSYRLDMLQQEDPLDQLWETEDNAKG